MPMPSLLLPVRYARPSQAQSSKESSGRDTVTGLSLLPTISCSQALQIERLESAGIDFANLILSERIS